MVKVPSPSFYVYLGPTIRGYTQKGAIYEGDRACAEEALSAAIAKYPRVAKLLISDIDLPEARRKLRDKGNALYEENRKFIQELSKGV